MNDNNTTVLEIRMCLTDLNCFIDKQEAKGRRVDVKTIAYGKNQLIDGDVMVLTIRHPPFEASSVPTTMGACHVIAS